MQPTNNYIAHLNFGEQGILKDPFDIEKTHIVEDLPNIWNLYPQFVNQEVVDKIENAGLYIMALDVLKISNSNTRWGIHADMGLWGIQEDSVRLNWVYGNKDCPMIFFEPKDPTRYDVRESPLCRTYVQDPFLKRIFEEGRTHSNYLHYEPEDVTEVYRGLVGFPSLVQSGVPHTVQLQGTETRYCISAIIGDKSNPYKPTTFQNALNKLSQYYIS